MKNAMHGVCDLSTVNTLNDLEVCTYSKVYMIYAISRSLLNLN